MASGDIYELTAHQTLFAQNIENVYFYEENLGFVTTLPTHAQLIAENWVAQKLDRIRDVQSNDVRYTGVTVRNLFDASDQHTLVLSLEGTATGSGGDTLGAFEAWSFSLQGDNPAVRNGFKRLAGVPENYQTDGVWNGDADQLARFTACEDALSEAIGVGTLILDPVFVPVIVKRVRSGTAGNYTYDLPETRGAAVWSQIVVAAFHLLITSQISRKIGVGS